MPMNRTVVAVASSAVILSTLTACQRSSQEERVDCRTSGGEIKEESFPYEGEDPSFWSGKMSGVLEYCETTSGAVGDVYNDEIKSLDTGFWGPNEDNSVVFELCTDANGRVYLTEAVAGKTYYDAYVCVIDGEVRQML